MLSSSAALPRWLHRAGLLLLLAAILFPLVFDVFRAPIQTWDESRLAANAIEMYWSHNWLVTTYQHQPDLWNTKPPLLIWLQVLLLDLGLRGEVAMRLPTVLACVATVLALYRFASRTLRNTGAGLLAGFILVTSPGYVREHVSRTGDYDALLILWITLELLAFYLYLETNRRRYLVLWAIALSASILTKGVAGLLGSPALVLYALNQRKLLPLLRQPAVWLALISAFAVPALYYLARERALPGYWHAVQLNELGGRFQNALESHDGPWYYYFRNAATRFFVSWLPLLPPSLLILAFERDAATRRLIWLLALFVGCWLLVISTAATKLEWYEAPLYPILALLIALALTTLFQRWQQSSAMSPRWQVITGTLALLALVWLPYKQIIDLIITNRQNDITWGPEVRYGYYLGRYVRQHPEDKTIDVYHPGTLYGSSFWFYRQALARESVKVQPHSSREQLNLVTGAHVIVCTPEEQQVLADRYQVTKLEEEGPCATFEVWAKK
ncbi:ArnT family glycosyltransferase [Hymenobacter sp. BT491]|uniref:ArnT family glycosyltransferase n=1 Tax=Hymenobacter sp. BT491 TaxID=2766779 RepID=UPI0016536F14|nr:glycosyltransferase family 39 protein [Hymenobacter sp. BT491]MBC6991810.1 glycosyltransferase family 39 protein [Hymenobacter sp. BT491]